MRVVFVLLLLAALARAEYVWNGSDWIWNEPETTDKKEKSVEGVNDDSYYEASGYDNNYNDDNYADFSGDDQDDDEDFNVDSYNERRNNLNVNVNNNVAENNDNNRDPVVPPFIVDVDEDIGFVDENGVDEDVNRHNRVDDGRDEVRDGAPAYASPNDDLGGRRRNHRRNHHATSFFAQPGTLAAVVGGAVVGLLCAILCVMFIVYRMRKKDEGSYALDEHSKRASAVNAYVKPPSREFFA